MSAPLNIRPATPEDWPAIRAIFQAVVRPGDTFPFLPDTPEAEARHVWLEGMSAVCVAEAEGRVVGSYYLKPNQHGLGNHVANAGYMMDPAARQRGIGRAMGEHSIEAARALGFTAMQFNFVVTTNEPAVRLWQAIGFSIIGRVPKAYRHATLGPVDVFIMHREI